MKKVFSWPYPRNTGRDASEQSESKAIFSSPPPHSDGAMNFNISPELFAQFCNEEPQPTEMETHQREDSQVSCINTLFQNSREKEVNNGDSLEEGEIREIKKEKVEEEYVMSEEDSAILEQAFFEEFSKADTPFNVHVTSTTPEVQSIKRKRKEREPDSLRLREWITNTEQETIATTTPENVEGLKKRIKELEAENGRLQKQVKHFKRHIVGACSSLLAY
jgi:hypothetical protein